jgi:hypothetical protein
MALISEQEFSEDWGAHAQRSGDFFTYEQTVKFPMHRVWTVVAGEDDSWYALPGYHGVNKLGYVITDRHWSNAEAAAGLEAVWFLQDEVADS